MLAGSPNSWRRGDQVATCYTGPALQKILRRGFLTFGPCRDEFRTFAPGRTAVNPILTTIAVCASAAVFAAPALGAADMSLTRLDDCGTPQAPIPVNQRFSDTYAYGDLKLQFVYSC